MKRSRFIVFCIVLAVFAASGNAQTVSSRKPVAEADLVKIIPALRTVAAQARQSRAPVAPRPDSTDERAAWLALLEDMKNGKIDPLEWIEAHSDRVIYPPLADYSEATSRLATGLSLRPCAVFGFGLEASELGLARLAGDREAERRVAEKGLDESDAQQKVNATVESVRLYYRQRKMGGFNRESPSSWTVQSPDSLFTVTIMEANIYRAWGSEALPSGPILELAWNETPGSGATGNSMLAEDLPVLLARAKMDEQTFLTLVTALVTARRDARDPARLEQAGNITPETPEEKQLAGEVKEIVRVRTENVRLYRRYARTLDPLLDVFDEAER